MERIRYTLKKNERLCKKKVIEQLTRQSENIKISEYPFLLIYKFVELPSPAQLLIAVSRKNFKTAVSRNKIKRIIRHLYRCNKLKIYEANEKNNMQLAIMIIYTAKELLPFKNLEVPFNKLIEKLCKNIA